MSGIFDQIINYSPPLIVSGTVNYKGTWDASTNNPTLNNPPASSTKGDYYVVSTAGTQFTISFAVGDWIISSGTAWEKVDLTDAVSSVFGRTGAVVGVSTDYSSVGLTNTAIGAANPSTGAFTTVSATTPIAVASGGTGVSTSTGTTNVVLSNSPTIVTPVIAQINDANGNATLRLTGITSATDYLEIKNAIGVGSPLHVLAEGASTNIGVHLQPKGSGLFTISDGTDFNKGIRFRSSSSAASAVTLIDAVSTAGRVVTLPDATGTLLYGGGPLNTPASGTVTNLTGTASININGTVGATTANTGAFTTLSSTTGATFATSSGNVGIGVTPSAWDTLKALDIGSGGGVWGTAAQVGVGSNVYYGTGNFRYKATNVAAALQVDGNIFKFLTAASGTADNAISFTQAMTLDASGNLALGISSTTRRLDVIGGNTYDTGFNLIAQFRNPEYATTEKGILLGYAPSTNASIIASGYAGGSGALAFWTHNNSSWGERMRLDASGQLGIGTTSPAYKLHVTNAADNFISRFTGGTSSNVNIGIYASTASSFGSIGTESNHDFKIYTNLVDRLVVSSTGLAVTGVLSVGPLAGDNRDIVNFYRDGTFEMGVQKVTGRGADWYFSGATNFNIVKRATYGTLGGTVLMTVDSSGKVGIGTSSPVDKLEVYSASGNNYITSSRASKSSGQVAFALGGGTSGTNWIIYQDTNSDNLSFFGNSATRMTLDNSGNLGIGTSSPAQRLHVQSGSAASSPICTTSVTGDTAYQAILISKFDNDSTTSQNFIQFQINNGGANCGRITANGANTAAFGSTSDRRVKENIADLPSQLANIMALRPVEFDYVESLGGGHQIGFVAQEMQQVYPDVIAEDSSEEKILSITGWSKTEARLVKALQELNANLVAQVAALSQRISALETK